MSKFYVNPEIMIYKLGANIKPLGRETLCEGVIASLILIDNGNLKKGLKYYTMNFTLEQCCF